MKKNLTEELSRIHEITYGDGEKYKEIINSLLSFFDTDTKETSKSIEKAVGSPTKNTTISNTGISKKGQELLSDPIFSKKLDEVCKNLGIQRDWLIQVMKKESGLDPYVTNFIGCVGLIQFCPDTARGGVKTIGGEKLNLSSLKSKHPSVQLDWIEKYYEPYKGRLNSYDDLYLVTFYPAALGKPDHYVIGGKTKWGLKISKQNPGIARAAGKVPGKDYLTVGDFKKYT